MDERAKPRSDHLSYLRSIELFLVGFLPRGRSPTTFFIAAATYIFAWTTLAPAIIAILHLWPATMDPVEHVKKPMHLGMGGNLAAMSLPARAVLVLVVAPIEESLMVIGLVALLRRFKYATSTQVIMSAFVMSFWHSLSYPVWGFLAAPPFLVGAAAYVYWRRTSFWLGAAMIVGLHSVSNLVPILNQMVRQVHW